MIEQRAYPKVLVILALLALLLFSTPTYAAAPWLVMIYGSTLAHPIIVSDWQENYLLVPQEASPLTQADLAHRPFFNIALFWGPSWKDYVKAGKPLDVLQPTQANQHAKFYPATNNAPAVWVFEEASGGPLIRQMEQQSLAVLEKYHIPTNLSPTLPQTGGTLSVSLSWFIVAGVFVLFVGSVLRGWQRVRRNIAD